MRLRTVTIDPDPRRRTEGRKEESTRITVHDCISTSATCTLGLGPRDNARVQCFNTTVASGIISDIIIRNLKGID